METLEKTSLLYPKHFLSVVSGVSSAILIHIVFLWVFLTSDVPPLYYFNFGSVFLFAGLLFIVFKKGQSTKILAILMIVASIEVITHQVFAVILLGWNYGFQYYLITIPGFILLGDFRRQSVPISFTVISFVTLISLYFYCQIHPPIFHLQENIRDGLYIFNLISFVVVMILFGGLFAHISRKYENKLLKTQDLLYLAATTDSMTKLSNRMKTIHLLENENIRTKRTGKPFTLAIADIDDFKMVNDTYGHDVGDAVILSVANIMKSTLREVDIIGRWGGEEFLLVLTDTNLAEGKLVLERMMENISNNPVLAMDTLIKVSMTLGVTSSNYAHSIEGIIKLADNALYEGKHGSKNCIVLSNGGN